MMQTFAYGIAAAFFLAAILMGGSFLRGFFPQEILRGFRLATGGLALTGAGVWIYNALPSLTAPASRVLSVPVSVPVAAKPEQKFKRVETLRESDRKAL